MRIALASDHAGFSPTKEIEALLPADGHETRDFGVEKYRRRPETAREISERHLRPLPPG